KSKWQEHINVYTNFLTPYNFSCYLLMLSKSHYLIALSYMIQTFIVFAVGYLIRPFGGTIIGMIADTYGRKKTFILVMLSMGFSTMGIGLLLTQL
ncbi:MAG TPA: hypothetical protein LFV91_06965, partial [Rickettsia endosymbiont of Bembidion nr. Transversale]|nr:hypothetical protein [Rickettsia endosymbiont of Bembidion nr. Transversale]